MRCEGGCESILETAVIIERVPLFRSAFAKVLKSIGVSQTLLSERIPEEPMPDVGVVVIALCLIEENGGTIVLPRLRRIFPNAKYIATSLRVNRKQVFELLAEGYDGFVYKGMEFDQMATAYRHVLLGNVYLPSFEQPHDADFDHPAAQLTHRQWEIVELMREGKTNKEIARDLEISPGTVKVHLNHVYRVLEVKNRVSALAALGQIESPADASHDGGARRAGRDENEPDFIALLTQKL